MNELLRRLLFLPEQRSTLAREIDGLHYVVVLTTMAGATLVALVAGYFILRYRQRHGRPRVGEPVLAEPALEKRPAAIPFAAEALVIAGLLGLFVLFWFIGFRQFVKIRVAPENALEVYVTGKQWMWNFAYEHGETSAATLTVPARRPVKLVLTSRDVVHSFFVPEFRLKQDAVPGRYTTLWFEATEPGSYEILCAEYCGTSHSAMRGRVEVLSPEEFERWQEGGRNARPLAATAVAPLSDVPGGGVTLAEMGERVAVTRGCLRCHSVDGSRHIGPSWASLYRSTVRLTSGGSVVADEAFLTESMMDPGAKIQLGYENVMPSYRGLLTAPETAALVSYIKSLSTVPAEPQTGPEPYPYDPSGTSPVAPLRPVPAVRTDRGELTPPPTGEGP